MKMTNDVKPGEVGSLLTRGPYTIRGYYKAEEHNAQSFYKGWILSHGEILWKVNEQGYIIVEGRDKIKLIVAVRKLPRKKLKII